MFDPAALGVADLDYGAVRMPRRTTPRRRADRPLSPCLERVYIACTTMFHIPIQDMATLDADTDDQSTREEILALLKEGMDEVSAAVAATDPTTTEEEKLQLRRYHELGYLANQYRKLQRDTDLDEMEEELALIEQAREVKDE